MIDLTVENARIREKQLENEIGKTNNKVFENRIASYLVDLKHEISKEQDCRQKLNHDFLQLQRVRSMKIHQSFHFIVANNLDILIKKLKRLNQSTSCSIRNNNLFNKPSPNTIQIESI